ncbi:hypothetical protein [Arthrobacter sp. UYEF3]|uniref:hypothetical protein n=1 Tax=Arthrobacter sp. UYEF3 TaxID=1756365 RepID=UPI0033974EF8
MRTSAAGCGRGGRHRRAAVHPIDLIAGIVIGKVLPWPVQSTVVAGVLATLLVIGVVLVLVTRATRASKRARMDKAARYLGRGK